MKRRKCLHSLLESGGPAIKDEKPYSVTNVLFEPEINNKVFEYHFYLKLKNYNFLSESCALFKNHKSGIPNSLTCTLL